MTSNEQYTRTRKEEILYLRFRVIISELYGKRCSSLFRSEYVTSVYPFTTIENSFHTSSPTHYAEIVEKCIKFT